VLGLARDVEVGLVRAEEEGAGVSEMQSRPSEWEEGWVLKGRRDEEPRRRSGEESKHGRREKHGCTEGREEDDVPVRARLHAVAAVADHGGLVVIVELVGDGACVSTGGGGRTAGAGALLHGCKCWCGCGCW
jgi:hypothetical protein